jgi:ParB family chromosome partitioning protein
MGVERLTLLKLEELEPSTANVRRHVDQQRVRSLAEDIAMRGLISPLIVRREGGKYGVVCGRMRLEAVRLLQREKPETYEKLFGGGVPCIVKELSDAEALELSLSENIRQNSLTPEEIGQGIARLADWFSEDEISRRLLVDIAQVRRALLLYRRISTVADYVVASRPGRTPQVARRRISRSGLASLMSVLEKKERRGEIRPNEKQLVLEVVKKVAEERPLTTSELELLASKIEREPDIAKSPERLREEVKQIVRQEIVQRVVAFRRSLLTRLDDYARQRQISFDEAVNELLEKALSQT